MKRKIKQRVVTGFLMLALLTSLASAVLAAPPGQDNWTWSESLPDKIKMSRSEAYSWITGELTRISLECSTALNASSEVNTTKILSLYGTYLIYLNWLTENGYHDGNQIAWTLFDAPGGDLSALVDYINTAETLRSKIVEKGLLPSTTDISKGTYNSSDAVGRQLPSGANVVYNGSLLSTTAYRDALARLVADYVDAHVLTALARHFEVTGNNRTDLLNALSAKFPASWYDSVVNGQPLSDMVSVISSVKKDIIPYLNIYNQYVAAYQTTSSRVLKGESFTVNGETYRMRGAQYQWGDNDVFQNNASYITRTLHMYIYSAQTGESTADLIDITKLDMSRGLLPLLSNAKIVNNEVKFDGATPELTALGYYILAAGVLYEPFVSIAGEDAYIDVLTQFLTTNQQKEHLVKVIQNAISTKKPLYVTEQKLSMWENTMDLGDISIATYKLATLADMLQADVKVTRAYAAVKGQMHASKVDASTFEYIQGGSTTTAQTTTAEIDTTQEQLEAGTATVGTDELIASGAQMTKPVAITSGCSGSASPSTISGIGAMTSMILHNASKDAKNNKYLKNPEKYLLFINGLGDIVLSDGTVVLPAIANPVLYGDFLDKLGVEDPSKLKGVDSGAVNGYYPYSVAFANHYPHIRPRATNRAELTVEGDIGKYILTYNTESGSVPSITKITGVNSSKEVKAKPLNSTRAVPIAVTSFSVTADTTQVLSPFFWRETYSNFYTSDKIAYMYFESVRNVEQQTFFPLPEYQADVRNSYIAVAAPLVTSAVRYISEPSASGDGRQSTGKIRVQSYIEDFVAQGMLGTVYTDTLIKNYKMSYDNLVEDQYGRLTMLIVQGATGAVNFLGGIDGALAIRNGYENRFFNMLVGFIKDAYLLIAIVLIVIIAVKFLRGRYSMVYVVFIAFLVFSGFWVYAEWMPTAVPAVYNFFVNDVVEDVVWNTVMVKAEQYDETYKDADRKDPVTGEPKPYTATITLYKMTTDEMEQIAERLGERYEDVVTGKIIFLDEDAGIFVQGDAIKMSVDKLLANNTMRGLYKTQWEQIDAGRTEEVAPINGQTTDNPYIIKLTNPYVSLESYYTPFCQFERAFLTNLNTFANIFNVDRNYYRYGANIYKDAFMFNAFTNSGIFTAPGNDEVLRENIKEEVITGSRSATADEIIELVNRNFTPQEDWLNLRAVFANPSPAMKDSLWGKMLQRQGYYNEDWTMTPEQEAKVSKLIDYINTQTKQFVIRNQSELNSLSDENAIKLTTLYATMMFNHRVSEFGYWLYPNYINAADLELRDILYGAMTSLYDRNAASDGDIVNTVVVNLGLGGALLVLFITVFSVLFLFILTYMIPVLYCMFGVILVWKLINEDSGVGLVKGYAKVTGATTVLYFCYSLGLKVVRMMGYKWYGYLATAVISALCLYFLIFIIISIVANPLELGNEAIARSMYNGLNRLTGGRLDRITASLAHLRRDTRANGAMLSMGLAAANSRGYRRSADIDGSPVRRRPRRSAHYGRWEDFDDVNLPMRARVVSRFGKISDHAAEVGNRKTGLRHTKLMRTVRKVQETPDKIENAIREKFANYVRR